MRLPRPWPPPELDWPVGAEIVITPTDYDVSQVERVTLSAVAVNGDGTTTLSVAPALAHAHTAVVVNGHTMAAGVGLVPRPITVTGAGHEVRARACMRRTARACVPLLS